MFRRIKRILCLIKQRIHYPLINLHSYDWSNNDHAHICIAARLLEEDDFKEVCPIANKKNIFVEREDRCDSCPYLSILNFGKNGDKKFIYLDLNLD